MAILPEVSGNANWKTIPKGTFLAICEDIKDEFGVHRKKYNSEEMEVIDQTQFRFVFKDPKSGEIFRITSRKMRISSHEKSSLYQALHAWCGEPPRAGWDFGELKGCGAMITIAHMPSTLHPGQPFATIHNIGPVPEDWNDKLEALKKAVADPAAKNGVKEAAGVNMPGEGW
ncbi:MAG TPA: hypothetical protein P5567_13985 [Kiritimatiellia bacterium]|nr:hypothetical protein [Kiritimatiellia bacterium]HRZ13551.1 hypothetical protein [Kiritimatiellia bacterium]HSA19144.1 hypothetical protein [Kiritimatiellia bacterium]